MRRHIEKKALAEKWRSNYLDLTGVIQLKKKMLRLPVTIMMRITIATVAE